ncbi:Asp23/Gls24 family envelope stress response protein, partial [Streptomyces sp. SID5785]|nr:Asp23/Gls24 family envelope stress response protein [Streptomyces sp. SID5785]
MTAHTDPPTARSGAADDDERLPCGRLLSQVWEAWEDRADDPHLRTCPH